MPSFLAKKDFLSKFSAGLGVLSRWCFYLFVFSVPFRIDVLFLTEGLYLNGFLSLYRSHFFYLSDLVFIFGLLFFTLSMLASSKALKSKSRRNIPTIFYLYAALLFFVFISLFWSFDRVNSIIYGVRLVQFIGFFFILKSGFLETRFLIYSFLASVLFSAGLGFFQYFHQGSLGLHFLGESILAVADPSVAKIDFFGKKIIRAYGIFPHPNIFAAYLIFASAFCFYIFQNSSGKYRFVFVFLLLLFLLVFLLTFSRSAYLALTVCTIFYLYLIKFKISSRKVVFLLSGIILTILTFDLVELILQRLTLSDSSNFIERGRFLSISKKMFIDHPFGVGMGNFTSAMQNYDPQKLMPWNFQPVHNLYLLILNELGFFGLAAFLAIFVYGFVFLLKNLKMDGYFSRRFICLLLALWIGVMILGMFDHYFWSLYPGQFLFWFFMGLIFYKEIDSKV